MDLGGLQLTVGGAGLGVELLLPPAEGPGGLHLLVEAHELVFL